MKNKLLDADEKRHEEAYQNLVRISETLHLDNMKFIRAFISTREDIHPIYDGTTKMTVCSQIQYASTTTLLNLTSN